MMAVHVSIMNSKSDSRCANTASGILLVLIDEKPVGYVERMTRRRLPPESSFWTAQARDLLSDYLRNEGKTPPTGKLTVEDFDPDKLPIAERWKED